MENASDQIFIVTLDDTPSKPARTERGLASAASGAVKALSVTALKENMDLFLGHLREVLGSAAEAVGGFRVEEVEVSVQITGSGQICLLGSGATVGAQGSVKFRLKRAAS